MRHMYASVRLHIFFTQSLMHANEHCSATYTENDNASTSHDSLGLQHHEYSRICPLAAPLCLRKTRKDSTTRWIGARALHNLDHAKTSVCHRFSRSSWLAQAQGRHRERDLLCVPVTLLPGPDPLWNHHLPLWLSPHPKLLLPAQLNLAAGGRHAPC